jgi:hypothetical protein
MKINSFATSSLVVLSLLFTAAGAYAQSAVQAHVPFAFKVGQKQMPAGTYVIDREIGSSFVTVRNVKTGTSVQAVGRTESASKKTEKLIFHHYGSQYLLAEIWGAAGSQGMVLPTTRQEKDLELAQGSANAGNNVEIASR